VLEHIFSTVCFQLLYNLPLTVNDISLLVSNGTNNLNLFHPIRILHQHLHLHSTCHLNNKTYPLTPHLHWHLCILNELLGSCNLYKQMSSSLYITTFPVYPLLTTSTLHWIITNASNTKTKWPTYSLRFKIQVWRVVIIQIYLNCMLLHKICCVLLFL